MSYTEDALRTESVLTKQDIKARVSPWKVRVIHAVFGLQTEVGELCDPFKKHLFYKSKLDFHNMREEIGDVCWYLAILADALGTTLEDCQVRNIAKLRARYPEKFTQAEALSRDLQAEREALEGGATAQN